MVDDDTSIIAVPPSSNQALNFSKSTAAKRSQVKSNPTLVNISPTLLDFIETKPTDTYCNEVRQYIGSSNTTCTYEKSSILVKKAPINGEIQILLPTSLRKGILNPTHYSLPAGHSGEQRVYESFRREFHSLHMVIDVFAVVNNCTNYSCIGTKFNHCRKLELLPPAGPFEFVTIDNLGPLPRN